MAEAVDVVVVGGGQAGLSLSHELCGADVEHVVLERARVAESWRHRWDSFCLVSPNWAVLLPGGGYEGDDPDGFMGRDQIVEHLAGYAASFRAPVREGVEVSRLARHDGGGFSLQTSDGELHARRVVLANGGYQRAHRPAAAAGLTDATHVIDASDYVNPAGVPEGAVLIVGSGQTGCQLAEELHEAGRDVHLACGRAPWVPRTLGDRDAVAWLLESGFMDFGVADLPSPLARLGANAQVSGRDRGHTLNFRTLAAAGVHLHGRLDAVEDGVVRLADDLAASVEWGDARYADISAVIAKSCAERGIDPPEMPPPPPFTATGPTSLPLDRLACIIFTSGYRPDYASWVDVGDAFDEQGFPLQVDGSSTVVDGLHFMGVHFQRKRKSATLYGVGEDATVLAERLAGN